MPRHAQSLDACLQYTDDLDQACWRWKIGAQGNFGDSNATMDEAALDAAGEASWVRPSVSDGSGFLIHTRPCHGLFHGHPPDDAPTLVNSPPQDLWLKGVADPGLAYHKH